VTGSVRRWAAWLLAYYTVLALCSRTSSVPGGRNDPFNSTSSCPTYLSCRQLLTAQSRSRLPTHTALHLVLQQLLLGALQGGTPPGCHVATSTPELQPQQHTSVSNTIVSQQYNTSVSNTPQHITAPMTGACLDTCNVCDAVLSMHWPPDQAPHSGLRVQDSCC
jgi:hypothetical protein